MYVPCMQETDNQWFSSSYGELDHQMYCHSRQSIKGGFSESIVVTDGYSSFAYEKLRN